ncbi:hypothetical protein MMC25_003474 [Agyrium rufum]|nr:hypothetical protein [Agyrium rufum]
MSMVLLKRLLLGGSAIPAKLRDTEQAYLPLSQRSPSVSGNDSPLRSSISTSVDLTEKDCSDAGNEKLLFDDEDGARQRLTKSMMPRLISDATIGLSDGLTVPFALSAGLSALGSTRVVIYGGIAELIAGAISMGLGGYLGARTEVDSYEATVAETRLLVSNSPSEALYLARSVFNPYNLPTSTLEPLLSHLSQEPHQLESFLLSFHHQLSAPANERAYISALTIAAGYFFGGLVPLIPYLLVAESEAVRGFWWSVFVMTVALAVFGYVKTCAISGWWGGRCMGRGIIGAGQMVVVGGLAAGAAMGLVRLLEG